MPLDLTMDPAFVRSTWAGVHADIDDMRAVELAKNLWTAIVKEPPIEIEVWRGASVLCAPSYFGAWLAR